MIHCEYGLLVEIITTVLAVEYALGKQRYWPVKSLVGAVEVLIVLIVEILILKLIIARRGK